MELNNFARIGKGVLTKAIGLQKNYVEEYIKVSENINVQSSGCQNCPIHKIKSFLLENGIDSPASFLADQCRSCSSVVYDTKYETRYKYINEKNRYGYQPTLKSYSIKLLMFYHFLQPDSNGFVKNISISSLADALGCTVATILSCNKVLSDYGYCYFCNSGLADKHINIYLPEYKNYHKSASEGGRGYLTLSQDMMKEFLQIKSLNTLRLQIKGILEVDLAQLRDANLASASLEYKKLRGFLPTYCKNNVIRSALKEDSALLHCDFSDRGVVFSVGSKYSQKHLRNELLCETQSSFEEYVDHLNDLLELASSDFEKHDDCIASNMLLEQGINKQEAYPPLVIKKDDYSSIASMILQYNLHIVRSAVVEVYNKYVVHARPIDNLGALVRTIIRKQVGMAV